ncbi:MAG TPA: apolipoprotein N-acyltransferase, partial [Sphingobacteriaceae bacterium]
MLALISAALLWLGWPPIPFSGPILLVALLPLFIALENVITSEASKKGRKVFLIAGLCFLTWNTASIYWVFNAMNAVMPAFVAFLISLIPFGLGALLMTLAFRLYYALRTITNKAWSYTGLICFWIGYEYLHQTWDLSFPWMNLGNGFASTHQLVQWYEFTGVYGGTLWILLANILAFETWRAYNSNSERKKVLLIRTVLHILIPVTVSLVMYFKYTENQNPSNIVVVQPNIDPYAKWGSLSSSAQIEKLIHLSDSAAQPNTEYFIWPETAIPEYINENEIQTNSNFLKAQDFLKKYKNGNLICGIESYLLYDSAKTPTARLVEQFG